MRFIVVLFFLGTLLGKLNAEKYVVLVSAGETSMDDSMYHSEYWYDLFHAYQELIDLGYSHDNILVLYGDGDDFQSHYPNYNASNYDWGIDEIVDLPNSKETIQLLFEHLGGMVTTQDEIIVRWLVGHGGFAYNANDYSVVIDNENDYITKAEILTYVTNISHCKSITFIWMTCHSGSLVHGEYFLSGNNIAVITSSSWDQLSYSVKENNVARCEMNVSISKYLSRKRNTNHTMYQLAKHIQNSSLITSTPQFYDASGCSKKVKMNFH